MFRKEELPINEMPEVITAVNFICVPAECSVESAEKECREI